MGLIVQVSEFIAKLTAYAAQSPENGSAEVMLQFADGLCYEIEKANDARGVPGEHFLILIPYLKGRRFGVRHGAVQ